MPGFSNYEITPLDTDQRKKRIENHDLTQLTKIIVTSPDPKE